MSTLTAITVDYCKVCPAYSHHTWTNKRGALMVSDECGILQQKIELKEEKFPDNCPLRESPVTLKINI